MVLWKTSNCMCESGPGSHCIQLVQGDCFLPQPRRSNDFSVWPCQEWLWSHCCSLAPPRRWALNFHCPTVTGIDMGKKRWQLPLGLETVTISILLFQAVLFLIIWCYGSELLNHHARSPDVTHNLCFITTSLIFFCIWENTNDISNFSFLLTSWLSWVYGIDTVLQEKLNPSLITLLVTCWCNYSSQQLLFCY